MRRSSSRLPLSSTTANTIGTPISPATLEAGRDQRIGRGQVQNGPAFVRVRGQNPGRLHGAHHHSPYFALFVDRAMTYSRSDSRFK